MFTFGEISYGLEHDEERHRRVAKFQLMDFIQEARSTRPVVLLMNTGDEVALSSYLPDDGTRMAVGGFVLWRGDGAEPPGGEWASGASGVTSRAVFSLKPQSTIGSLQQRVCRKRSPWKKRLGPNESHVASPIPSPRKLPATASLGKWAAR